MNWRITRDEHSPVGQYLYLSIHGDMKNRLFTRQQQWAGKSHSPPDATPVASHTGFTASSTTGAPKTRADIKKPGTTGFFWVVRRLALGHLPLLTESAQRCNLGRHHGQFRLRLGKIDFALGVFEGFLGRSFGFVGLLVVQIPATDGGV